MEDFVSVLSTALRAICVRFVLQDLNSTVFTLTLLTALFLEGGREGGKEGEREGGSSGEGVGGRGGEGERERGKEGAVERESG